MKIIFEGNDVTEEYKTTGKVEVPLRVINSCVMTINLTNGVSKDVDFATDDVRATVDNRPNLKKKCRFGRLLLCDNCPNLKKNCRFGWLLLYLQQ